MRSAVVFVVEHDDTTDPLEQFIANALSEAEYEDEVTVRGYAVRVDLPTWTWMHPPEVLFEREV